LRREEIAEIYISWASIKAISVGSSRGKHTFEIVAPFDAKNKNKVFFD